MKTKSPMVVLIRTGTVESSRFVWKRTLVSSLTIKFSGISHRSFYQFYIATRSPVRPIPRVDWRFLQFGLVGPLFDESCGNGTINLGIVPTGQQNGGAHYSVIVLALSGLDALLVQVVLEGGHL